MRLASLLGMQSTTAAEPSGAASISASVAASVLAKILYLVTRFALPPIVLAYIGLDDFGLWATCFLVVAYLGTGTFGVTFVYVRWVAVYAARGDAEAINRLASTGITLVALINATLFAGLYLGLPYVLEWIGVDPARRELARVLVLASTGVFLLEQVFGVFTGVLEGLQRLPATNAIWSIANLVECGLVVGMLPAGYGLYSLPLAYAVRAVVAVGLSGRECRRALPSLRLRPGRIDREALGFFVGFGGLSQLSGILSMALRSAEKVLAGAFLGTGATALYDLGEKLPMMAAWLPAGIGVAIFPAGSRLAAADRDGELRRLYLDSARAMALATGILVAPLLVLATPLLTAWLGADPRLLPAATILAVFTIPYHCNAVTAAASTVFRARGEASRELVYPLLQTALLGLFVWQAFNRFGTTLEAINAAVAGAMILSAMLYFVYGNRRLGVSQRQFAVQVIVPAAVPYGLACVAVQIADRLLDQAWVGRFEAIEMCLLTGSLYLGLLVAVAVPLLLQPHERALIRQRFARSPLAQVVAG